MSEPITSAIAGGVMTLTLNRPEKKNAITDEMYGALADGLERAAANAAVRAILILSAGDSFTAGNDISSFVKQAAGEAPPPAGPSNVSRFVRNIAACAKPIVAGVRGQAVGIGLTMLLHCDLVVVARDARLSAPFVNLALVPEAASSRLLVARLGHVRAFSIFATGQAIDGETAVQWGLANRAVAADEVDAAAKEAAALLASRPAQAVMITKRLMRDHAAISQQIETELVEFTARLASPEAKEAFQAFAERRAPNFVNI